MSVLLISNSKLKRYLPPVARAQCDSCGALGPEVECRMPSKGRHLDQEALRLACALPEWFVTQRPHNRATMTYHLCRNCATKRLFELQRAYAQALHAAGGRLGSALRLSWDLRQECLEADMLRRYLGVGEYARPQNTAS